jgi:ATP phosphoribosyltransferase
MTAPVILAIPSKGRLKEQAEAWLTDCGFRLEVDGGERGYRASLSGLPGVQVQLLSAGDIAAGLEAGDLHLGVTGEDLLRERGDALGERIMLLKPLGFGRADLVVAAPQSWLDVETMADVEEVAAAYLHRAGRRLRVATKYMVQTRAFFARMGVADYRIVESSGATEGAPAAGAAELIVDITTTGATLAANGLKILSDGLILKSQAQLAAGLSAPWTPEHGGTLRRLLGVVEARARALKLSLLAWPLEQSSAAEAATESFVARGASRRAHGLLADSADLFDIAAALAAAEVGPVSVTRPEFAFEPVSEAAETLATRLGWQVFDAGVKITEL